MSLNAAALRILAAKGLSAQDIADIATALEECAPRSPAAVRQARYRQRGGGNIPEEMRQEIFERDGFACVECSSEDYLQCDHIHPVSRGGETSLDNLQTLCRVCNARKRDRVRKQDTKSIGNSNGSSRGKSLEKARSAPPKENISNPCPVSDETEQLLARIAPKSKRGTRLAEDFDPPADWIDWAVKKRGWSKAEAIDEAECFARYWQAKPGREACKLDWPKTWQNWVTNSRRKPDATAPPVGAWAGA